MSRNPMKTGSRSAFTLVEMVVVLLIIAILASLVTSVVVSAAGRISEVQTRTEISELEAALRAFMSDYGLSNPPPSLLVLNEFSPLSTPSDNGRSAAFLQSVFGKNLGPTDWNGDGLFDGPLGPNPSPLNVWTLQGHQALIFYLGGIPNLAAGPQGFSTNNMKPSYGSMVGETTGKRRGPYYPFITSRLVATPTMGFFFYQDPWQAKPTLNGGTGPMPYVYFSSYGINNGYSSIDCGSVTYTDALGAHSALPYYTGSLSYTNSNTYQIISAGKDGKFGYLPSLYGTIANPNQWFPTGANIPGWTAADDQANFSSTLLGKGQN
jgi:prepilin-type N-terminal cleavage/methylation domain-containing protein